MQNFPVGVKIRGHILMEINNLVQETTYFLQIRVSVLANMQANQWANTLPSTDIFLVTTSDNERRYND